MRTATAAGGRLRWLVGVALWLTLPVLPAEPRAQGLFETKAKVLKKSTKNSAGFEDAFLRARARGLRTASLPFRKGSRAEGGGGGAGACVECLAGSAECGSTVAGILEAGDCLLDDGTLFDVWRIDLDSPSLLSLRLRSDVFDTFLILLDATCAVISVNDDCTEGDFDLSCLDVPLAAGTYFVVANTFARGEEGAYTLEAVCAKSTFCRDCTAAELQCGESLDAALTDEDCTAASGGKLDIFRFELAAETTVRLRVVSGTPQDFTFDAVLTLLHADCARLASNDDCRPGQLNESCLIERLPAGTYYAAVTSLGSEERGAYRISLDCARFELCKDCVRAGISCGEELTGAYPQGECFLPGGGQSVHLVPFDLDEAGPVRVSLRSGEFDTFLHLYDSSCSEIASNDDCGPDTLDSCLEADLEAGRYFLGVSSFAPGERGSYVLALDCPDVSACRDCSGEPLACGSEISGQTGAQGCVLAGGGPPYSVHELELPAAARVRLEVEAGIPEISVALLDRSCKVLLEERTGAGDPAGTAVLEHAGPPGRYYVRVAAGEGKAGAAYVLRSECVPFNPCRDCNAGELACDEPAAGNLGVGSCVDSEGGFFDVWTFDLPENREVEFRMRSSVFDTFLVLMDSECLVLARNDDCSGDATNSCLTMPLAAGRYYVGATSFASGVTGAYTLEARCREIGLCRNCLAGDIACNDSVQGELAPSKCVLAAGAFADVYRLEIPAATAIEIDLESEAVDSVLFLLDSGCVPIASDDDCTGETLDSCLRLDLEPGVYYVVASSFAAGERGPYRLTVRCDLDLCSACTLDDIDCGRAIRGNLPGGPCARSDIYRLEIKREELVHLFLESRNFDPVLRLYDRNCEELAWNDDCRRRTLSSCLDAGLGPGTYFLVVESFFPEEGGNYILSLACGEERVLPGDCDSDGMLTISDAACLLHHLFLGGEAPLPCGDGTLAFASNRTVLDYNDDLRINVTDAVGIFLRLFFAGPPPALGTDCVELPGCNATCGG